MKKPFFSVTIAVILFCLLAFNPYAWQDRDAESEYLSDKYDYQLLNKYDDYGYDYDYEDNYDYYEDDPYSAIVIQSSSSKINPYKSYEEQRQEYYAEQRASMPYYNRNAATSAPASEINPYQSYEDWRAEQYQKDWDEDLEREQRVTNEDFKSYEERRRDAYIAYAQEQWGKPENSAASEAYQSGAAYLDCYDNDSWECLDSDVYDVSDPQTRLYVIGVKPAAKALAYSPSGYTAVELIQSGRPRIKRKDGTSFFDGFYQAPNNNFFPVNTNAVKAAKATGCDKNYQGACIPIVDFDLQCSDIPEKNFRVVGEDIHNFDGDHDGIACEPYYP